MATQYRVWMECRAAQALGEFAAMPFDVDARTAEVATYSAVDAAHDLGLETRFPLQVVARANYAAEEYYDG